MKFNFIKKIISTSAAVFLPFALYAQTNDAEEEIQLPDVTTVVTGDSLTAGKNAIPDFNAILPSVQDSKVPLPVLPSASAALQDDDEPVANLSTETDRLIYCEGLIGGGYHGFFTGDFSVYKSSGDSPFKIQFSHEATNGYGVKKALDGYFDSNTLLSAQKQFTAGPFVQILSGSYGTVKNGFQKLSPNFFDRTQQTIKGFESSTFNLPYGFSLALSADAELYSRYEGIIANASQPYTNIEASADVLTLKPLFRAGWSNFGADIGLSASYNFEALTSSTEDALHRGQFGLDASWKNDFLSFGGDVNIVVGNYMTKNTLIVPFNFNMQFQFPIGKSERNALIYAEGGLSSNLPMYSELESKYLYSYGSSLFGETSDWYGLLNTSFPIASSFNLEASAEFKTTAFGNGVWEPLYCEEQQASGLYAFAQKNRTCLNTNAAFSHMYKIMTLTANWKGYWIDLPVLEDPNTLGLELALQGTKGNWGFNLAVDEALGPNVDFLPLIDTGAFFKLTNSLRLQLEVNDLIKLCTGDGRAYGSSKYITRAGSATILVKFFF